MPDTPLPARLASAFVAVALSLGAPSLGAVQARAQEAAAASLEVVSLPVWWGLGDPFGIQVRITNEGDAPLEDYGLVVGLLNRAETRSALHASHDLSLVDATNSLPVLALPDDALPPGSAVTVTIDQPIESLVLLGPGAASGVYPLKLTLQDSLGARLDTETTQLLFYPEPHEVRLTVVPVVPLHDLPARAPDGVFRPDHDGRFRLEEAVADGGWLITMLEVLEEEVVPPPPPPRRRGRRPPAPRPLRLGIVPSARLVEELADMADGYPRTEGDQVVRVPSDAPEARAAREVLDRLGALLQQDGVQPVLAPYAFADLPSIAITEGAVARQMSEAALVLRDVLRREIDPRWVFPPGGRLDALALSELPPGAAGLRTFFSPDSLEPQSPQLMGCPVLALSVACPLVVRVPTGGTVTGYGLDPHLQRHLVDIARAEEPRLAMQRFFAETAMIREESPGLARVVHATLSAAWRPHAAELRTLLRTMARAPWMTSATPRRGISATDARAERDLVPAARELADQPSDTYFAAVEEAGDAVEHFLAVEPPAGLAQRLQRNVLVALSRAWWNDRETDGFEYAGATADEVEEELAKIGTVGAQETTLTSSEGAVQFVVFNETGYEVRVRVRLDAHGELEVAKPVRDLVISSDQQSVSYDVTARASGIFPITLRLETPDGRQIQEPQTITVRSTEFNEIALGLTFGALAFLVLFYVVRVVRRRRPHGTGTGGA